MSDQPGVTDILRDEPAGDLSVPGDPLVPSADTSDVASLFGSAMAFAQQQVTGGAAVKSVMTGWTHERTQQATPRGPTAGDGTLDLFMDPSAALRGPGPATSGAWERTPSMQTVDRVARDVFVMPDDDLQQLQYKLFAAGFFGNSRFEEIGWRTPGPETFKAFTNFLDFAAEWRGNDGNEVPWFTVLDELAGTGAELDANAQTRMGEVGQPTQTNQLTDPAALRTTFDRAAQTVLGRKLGTREQRTFVSMFQDMQRQASAQQFSAQQGPGGSVDVTQPSLEAQALEFARGQDPNLARANDTAKTYESFLNIIGGR